MINSNINMDPWKDIDQKDDPDPYGRNYDVQKATSKDLRGQELVAQRGIEAAKAVLDLSRNRQLHPTIPAQPDFTDMKRDREALRRPE